MKKGTAKSNPSAIYQVGLNKEREAVISAHFMQDINQQLNVHLYSTQEFSEKAFQINSKLIVDRLIPILLQASDKFILERVAAAKKRAREHFKKYGLNSPEEVGLPEKITEVMFDRQFIKGSKSNTSRRILVEKIRTLIAEQKPIKMVIPALPYKSTSPLKTRGAMPDLSEVHFLLGLTEIVRTIDFIYNQESTGANNTMASFTIIGDGKRFNEFLNEAEELIDQYQARLLWWIKKLGIANYVEILDYQDVILNVLSPKMQLEKKAIRDDVSDYYTTLMHTLFNPYDMNQTFRKAIDSDPDPESQNPEGRYIPLFKSLIYIVHYSELANYCLLHGQNYVELYIELTRHLFEPYIQLNDTELLQIRAFITNPQVEKSPTQEQLFEYLRQSMLKEAWRATISYLAEIRSDRDLPQEPISTCFPNHIRWTIHAKPGQLAVLTTTAFGDPVQPWHGVGVFMRTKYNKIKLYTLPVLALEGSNAIPVTVEHSGQEFVSKNQPLFYVHPDIKFTNIDDLLEQIQQGLIRKRKH